MKNVVFTGKQFIFRDNGNGYKPGKLVDLGPDQCKWPVNENMKGHIFCGAETKHGRPYCDNHKRTSVMRFA